jgi:putative endonuclease
MQYVYVLQSKKDDDMYIGCTNDLRKRLKLHNSGKVKSTKLRKPFRLIYYESYLNKHDAFEREKFFKTGWGRNYVKRVLKNYFINQKI